MKIARKSSQDSEQLAHVTQEMYKQNLELADKNKTLTLLQRIDQIVLGSATEVAKITQTISSVLVSEADFSYSAIYVIDKFKSNVTASGMASKGQLAPNIQELIKANLLSIPVHSAGNIFYQALTEHKIQVVSGFVSVKSNLPADNDEQLKSALGVNSLFICPLVATNRALGVLVIGVPMKKEEISPYLSNLAGRLTSTISIAVENHLLYEELQEVSARLRVQNQRLKELDQTKDEFIGMASHQLRTPLTAIKGYLSMILDGDTGKVTAQQQDMIQRAFDGAQKMVYLIADMLNVSRLQTGKFVLENKPTYLPDVIQGEVDQLQEAANNKEVIFKYQKPEQFPSLNLDETKMRQVIMNFLDNALYYTPKGGEVTVKLETTDESVTCTVTDNGIGVPKSVQHQLFAKFYRADNAKKMRPDGTGLGLFMAKKVVVAQGGAIIFSSTEGKGSTFGFSFPRNATEIRSSAAAPVPELKKN